MAAVQRLRHARLNLSSAAMPPLWRPFEAADNAEGLTFWRRAAAVPRLELQLMSLPVDRQGL